MKLRKAFLGTDLRVVFDYCSTMHSWNFSLENHPSWLFGSPRQASSPSGMGVAKSLVVIVPINGMNPARHNANRKIIVKPMHSELPLYCWVSWEFKNCWVTHPTATGKTESVHFQKSSDSFTGTSDHSSIHMVIKVAITSVYGKGPVSDN